MTASLPYSELGEFSFCNLQTWDKSNDSAIKQFAVQQTSLEGGNITVELNKTTDQIIQEFHMQSCVFPRDSLFTFVIADTQEPLNKTQIGGK